MTTKLNPIKKAKDYRDELLDLGLECNDRVFTLPEQLCREVSIRIADQKYAYSVGNNPRIAFTREAPKNQLLCQALSNLNLKGKTNLGITLENYDFLDKRSAEDLAAVLVMVENEYRSLI
ncbi:hypothetical protein [Photobacterium leiognathi]|uniref:hypothetical protein n=1 Tax=Photobacterium leiognathi TaxID=553611 RepID=UPI002980FACB|nr:hypothetical protein [Photobacterium leiognathi]